MVKSYCVKQKKITECIPDSARLVQLKNGRFMMKWAYGKPGNPESGNGTGIRNPEPEPESGIRNK